MLSVPPAASLLKSAMLTEHAKVLPTGDEWFYEPNFAGERVLAVKEDAGVKFQTIAHSKDVTNRFPVLAALVARLSAVSLVLEATLCGIETWQQEAFAACHSLTAPPFGSATMRLIASDLLWFDGMDIRQCPLHDRKARVRQLVAGTSALEPLPLSPSTADILAQARQFGADAVIAKRRNSRYRPFARSGDWIRVNVDAATHRSDGADRELELTH